MLYLIIPPVLVILSLVGIIIFLMKKATALANFENKILDKPKNDKVFSKSFFSKFIPSLRLKPVFLKIRNLFSSGKDLVGRKIKKREEKKPYILENRDENYVKETPKIVLDEKPEPPKNVAGKKDLFEKILIERIAANPKDIEAYERLGEYYMEIENWNYSKECFKQVIKLNPGSVKARMKMQKLGRFLGRQ